MRAARLPALMVDEDGPRDRATARESEAGAGPQTKRDPLPIVAAESVGLSVGGQRVLDGVDLRLAPGSLFVLLGENGAGKTTLMRTLCGRTAPSTGRVRVDGRDPRVSAAARRLIGYVPQTIALYPELTVRENLAAFGAYAGGAKRPARPVDTILATLGLDEVADRRVGHLSGGYQRRVNLGAALGAAPAFLVLDEPTVGLDRDAKAVLLEAVRMEARRGAAVLLTTHDLEAAAVVADRIGILAHGRIVAEGEPRALLERTYGGRLSVRFRPAAPAGPALAERLTRCGLVLRDRDGSWCSPPLGVAPEVVAVLTEAVAVDGSGLEQLAVARPGLKELYAALMDQDTDR